LFHQRKKVEIYWQLIKSNKRSIRLILINITVYLFLLKKTITTKSNHKENKKVLIHLILKIILRKNLQNQLKTEKYHYLQLFQLLC